MKVWLLVVGKAGPLVADGVAEYERRAARYWSLKIQEVKEERARKGASDEQVRQAESERLLERVPPGAEVCALTREGTRWSSQDLANYLSQLAVQGREGAAFLIGGALGLSPAAIERADRKLSLSSMTMTA